MYHQAKFAKWSTVEKIIYPGNVNGLFWLSESSLWPWPWRQQSSLFTMFLSHSVKNNSSLNHWCALIKNSFSCTITFHVTEHNHLFPVLINGRKKASWLCCHNNGGVGERSCEKKTTPNLPQFQTVAACSNIHGLCPQAANSKTNHSAHSTHWHSWTSFLLLLLHYSVGIPVVWATFYDWWQE